MKKLTSALLVFVMLFSMNPVGIYAGSPNNDNAQKINQMVKGVHERKDNLDENQKKLSTDLTQLLEQDSNFSIQKSKQAEKNLKRINALIPAGEAGLKGLKKTNDDLVYVYIKLKSKVKTNKIDMYANTVISRDDENSIAAVWVEKGKLKKLASLGDVQSIQTVLPPVVKSGSANTQGDALQKADIFRGLGGVDGTGIKIGIISDGANNWTAARDSGDLPDNVHVLSDTVGGDEGTAMLEIVHDLAPGAELYFHDCGSNVIAFNDAIDSLVAAGCNVVCDDISWLGEPYFQDGIIASHVNSIISSENIVYVSSAGNFAACHYQGQYRDYIINTDDGDQYHINDFGTYESGLQYLPVYVPAGRDLTVILQWNDKFGYSSNDYDAYLWNSNGDLVDYSEYTQDGNDDPIEALVWHNSSASGEVVFVEVDKYKGISKTLEILTIGSGVEVLEYGSGADSIFGHSAAPNAIAVGSINASDPDGIAYYSSLGPTTISYPSATLRKKPDICGIDGVSVTGAGGFSNPFYGTSAAAPHVAAVAALVWSQNPDKSAAAIRSLVCSGTVDYGTAGFDYVYGNGLSDAVKAGGPSAPAKLSVAPGDRQVTLSWGASTDSDLAGYQLEYKTAASTVWTAISAVKTATSYTIANLVNNTEYQFRFKAKDTSNAYSIYSNTVNETPYTIAKISATVENTYKEGLEDGKKITVALTNGTFIPTLDADKIHLAGLPSGVTQGAVTRTGDNALTLALAGNSTVDYDTDIAAQLTIAADQVSAYKPADLSCPVTLKATVEPKPVKPVVTFSYDGTNAGQIKGITDVMEYSLDGGITYTPAVSANQALTGEELYNINANKDILVRVAATLRAPVSDTATIAIAPGPSVPAVTGNDIINMLTGMTTLMEFTTDTDANVWDWSWTRYATIPAPNNLPSLNGDSEFKVRIAGRGATMPSAYKLIEFNENEPLEVSAAYNGLAINEGKESGKLITVTLTNGQFVSAISKDMFQLSGLPAGISKGSVTRIDNSTVTISLLNNSTNDYDTDYEATIKIDKNQILPLQPDNTKTSVVIPAFDDPVPAPPNVTFSFKTNPGKLMGSDTTMEYSLDGGATDYKPVTATNMQLIAAQLASLYPAATDIRIRVKKTQRAVTGEDRVLKIDPVPGLPPIDASDADLNNRLQGIGSTMEFSIDKGKTWKAYNGSNLPADLTGNLSIMVRIAATDSAPAGPAATYTFTATNPSLSIHAAYTGGTAPSQKAENGYVIEVSLTNGKFASKLTATEIKVAGLPAGITVGVPARIDDTTIRIPLKGNAAAYYDIGTVLTVSVGKGQVLPAQPAALTTTMRLLDADKLPAPTGIDFSFVTDAKGVVTGTLSGVNNTMEYSLDGGVKYTPIISLTGSVALTSAQTAVITESKDIRVRFKAILTSSTSASNDYVIDIERPAAPSVTNDDAVNSITGIDGRMLFSTNGGTTWNKYTETGGIGNLPKLDGNLTLTVRLFAEGYNLASSPATLKFTSTNPGLSISAASFSKSDDSSAPIIEGSEGSRYIIVTLANGKFAGPVSAYTVKVTGLPSGVSVPSTNGIILINDNTQIKILLQGSSTIDYDVDKTVTVTVDKSRLLPAPQPLSLTTSIAFAAVDEDAPAAPDEPDFSFDGPNAKKLTGVDNTMEYSLDGGIKYTAVVTASGSPNAVALSSTQIAAIKVDKDIKVRYKATAKAPASNPITIDIVKPDVPSGVTYDDDANNASGMDITMEFSTDSGKTWKVYTGSNLPADLTGNLPIKVRTFASGHNIASDPVTLAFTSARPALAITAEFVGDTPVPGAASYTGTIRVSIAGDTAEYGTIAPLLTLTEIKLTGLPAGIKQGTAVRIDDKTIEIPITGLNVAYYDSDKTVTVSIGKAQVRPVQAAALTAPLTFPGDKSPRSGAPSGIGFSITTGKITGVNTTMEYSLNGGSTYIAVTSTVVTLSASQIASIDAGKDILVRYKAIPLSKTPASENYVIDITRPAAPDISWSDETNSITGGIDSTMEFSTDNGKTWVTCIDPITAKNNVTAKNLTGNLNIQIRLKKAGASVAGEAALLSFTADNPTLTLSGGYSGTTEGQENGNTITVTLENGKLVSSLLTTEVVITGLPQGVTVARYGITRVNDTQIRILLSGNSTEDYDIEKAVTVTVGKSQLLPAPQTNPVSAEIDLPATDESTSEAPAVTFSFSGANAGRLMGITTAMEYSIDGGTKYTPATAGNVKMSSAQIAEVTADDDILVRVSATLRDPAGETFLIEISPGPDAPDVTADDENDTVTDLDTSMEYSMNNGLTWVRYNGANAPVITGNGELLVRFCAADTTEAGEVTVLYFSEDNPELGVSAAYSGEAPKERNEDNAQISVTLTDGEFIPEINSDKVTLEGLPTGVSLGSVTRESSTELLLTLAGKSTVDYDSDLDVTVKVGKNLTMPSQAEDLTNSITLPASIETDQYGIVADFDPKQGFREASVKLFTADEIPTWYHISDDLEVEATPGQLVAFGVYNESYYIEAPDVADAGITADSTELNVVDETELTIGEEAYVISNNVIVYTYDGVLGGTDCVYAVSQIAKINNTEAAGSPVSIYVNQGEVVAILVPVSRITID